MADTQRSLVALQSLLADNSTGDISPQDLRDFLVSALGGYASMHCAAGSIAQTADITAAALTCWNGNGSASSGVTPDHANDRVTVSVAGDYLVTFAASLRATAGRTVKLQLRQNGVAVAGASAEFNAQATTDIACLTATRVVTCAASDVLTVYISASADGTNVTVSEASLSIKRVG